MIRIRELRKTGTGEATRVHISYFAQVEDQNIYQEITVDDFDVESATVEQVESIVEENADTEAIMNIYKSRKRQLSNTYRHDGQAFKRDLVLVDWEVGASYEVDDIVEFEGDLYRCVQAHTASEPTWTPVATAALWSPILVFADEHQPWKQPQGAHDAYPLGAIVKHNDQLWMSDHEANVWEPPTEWVAYDPNPAPDPDPDPDPEETPEWEAGVAYAVDDQVTYQEQTYRCQQAHTSQAGWEPPNAPALWEEIT